MRKELECFFQIMIVAGLATGLVGLIVLPPDEPSRLRLQVVDLGESPQKPTEAPTTARSPTTTYVWPTLTPGTPTPQAFDYTFEEVGLLASSIACEAGTESREGRRGVAWVAKTRHDMMGQSYTEVLLEPGAFTCWQLEAGSPQTEIRDHYCEILELEECQEILTVAINVINGWVKNPMPGATHFYSACQIEEPSWANDMEYLGQIGCHRFYVSP